MFCIGWLVRWQPCLSESTIELLFVRCTYDDGWASFSALACDFLTCVGWSVLDNEFKVSKSLSENQSSVRIGVSYSVD